MKVENVGILHPGAMGISLAASARNSGHHVHWVPAGRSPETARRAADEVAAQVTACGFKGVYADVNAISPLTVVPMARAMSDQGIDSVDGGIIGGPGCNRPDPGPATGRPRSRPRS